MTHSIRYRPAPPLDRFVEFLWASDAYVAQAPRERVLPSGAQTLVVHLGASPVRIYSDEQLVQPVEAVGGVVCGARTRPLLLDTALGPTVGAHFKPGGAHPFFAIPADAIAEQVVALEALWGPSARALCDQLLEVAAADERVRVLEAHLVARLDGAPDVGELGAGLRASLTAFEDRHLGSVAEVQRRTGLSSKRLLALFRDRVGLNPKAFWRVRRFRGALHDLDRGTLGGAALAQRHGYFDQAHFLREFRVLAGSNPRQYLATRVVGTDHVSVYGPKDPIRSAAARVSSWHDVR